MAYASLVGTNAHAATATGNFDVTINLTSGCKIDTSATGLTMEYVAFGSEVTASTSVKVTCTDQLGYLLALDGNTTNNVTGLTYTLDMPVTDGTGNGLEQTYAVDATIAAGQAGACPTTGTGCSGTDTRTLTVTY